MDSFEWNKVAAAILATLLMFMGLRELGAAFYHVEQPEELAYAIEVPDAEAGAGAAEEEAPIDLGTLLLTASASAGERVAKKCVSCHSFDKGGKTGNGPNLWDIVGAASAAKEGFNYSPAMAAYGKAWTFENLFNYLEKPSAYLPGTGMSFAGLRKPEDRANILAYMQTLSDAPAPFPAPAVVEAPAPEEPAPTPEESAPAVE